MQDIAETKTVREAALRLLRDTQWKECALLPWISHPVDCREGHPVFHFRPVPPDPRKNIKTRQTADWAGATESGTRARCGSTNSQVALDIGGVTTLNNPAPLCLVVHLDRAK